MRKLLTILALVFTVNALAATATIGGYTWTYRINGDGAEIYGPKTNNGCYVPAVSPEPYGNIEIPSSLGGRTVTRIGSYAFFAVVILQV